MKSRFQSGRKIFRCRKKFSQRKGASVYTIWNHLVFSRLSRQILDYDLHLLLYYTIVELDTNPPASRICRSDPNGISPAAVPPGHLVLVHWKTDHHTLPRAKKYRIQVDIFCHKRHNLKLRCVRTFFVSHDIKISRILIPSVSEDHSAGSERRVDSDTPTCLNTQIVCQIQRHTFRTIRLHSIPACIYFFNLHQNVHIPG